ncbi:MAG: FG-GAP-like repeat-containing protein [Bacteroidota bacterium]
MITKMNHSFVMFLLCILFYAGQLNAQLYVNASANLPNTEAMSQSMDVRAADLDGDGDLDIVLANEFQHNILLFNDGNGQFSPQPERLPKVIHDSEDVAIEDFDQDGDLDLVFCSEDDLVHEYYWNDGNGQFSGAPFQFADSKANAVIAADLNDDNYPDLIFGNDGQNRIWMNQQNGHFVDETNWRYPSLLDITQDVQLADVDGDQDLDLFVGNENGNKLLINDGMGVFSDQTADRIPLSVNLETRKVSFGDIDQDGDLDIFLSNVAFIPGKNRRNRLLVNDGTGHFEDVSAEQLPPDNEDSLDGVFLDIDGDADLDLLVANINLALPGLMRAYRNDGTGHFSEQSDLVFESDYAINALGIFVADLNGDNLLDLYICDRNIGGPFKDILLLREQDSVTSLQEKEEGQWLLFPNPIRDHLKLTFPKPLIDEPQFKLVDGDGKLLDRLTAVKLNDRQFEINFSNFTKSVDHTYWLIIKTDGQTWSEPLRFE